MKNETTVKQESDREVVVTRTFNAPARLVFEAWTRAELMRRWWVPKSLGMNLLSCEMDARVGGKYRLVFDRGEGPPMAFFGTYVEVTPPSRLVWTNEEAGDAGQVTTVTFDEREGKTRVVMSERYPTKEAFEAAGGAGASAGTRESFEQLDELLAAGGAADQKAP